MNAAIEKKQKLVDVHSVLLWAAAKKAQSEGVLNQSELAQHLSTLPTETGNSYYSLRNRGIKLRKVANADFPSAVIPFTRDPLDVMLAVRLAGSGAREGFKFFSSRSRTTAGFIRVRGQDVEYVDKLSDTLRFDSNLPEFLSSTSVTGIDIKLNAMKPGSFKYQLPLSGDKLLGIQGDWSGFRHEFLTPCKVNISIWRAPDSQISTKQRARAVVIRQLGAALLVKDKACGVILDGIAPETVLELTAASLAGSWLLIQGESFRVLGPLPDLTDESASTGAFVDSTVGLDTYTLGEELISKIPEALALQLAKTYPWFIPSDSGIWLEALAV